MTKNTNRLVFNNKIILAPMVRVGTLPMRLLALDYGADIVYTEELIDWKLLKSIRHENSVLGTVDYIDETDGTIVFRTCAREKDRVVLQLGTCDAQRALSVAKIIEQDVAAIDINMGCPKEFSLKGGMGAALLTQPAKATDILRTLVQNTNIPITCKIRVFDSCEETLELVRTFVTTGISAIAVHGRTKNERPQHRNRIETIRFLAENIDTIPIIANGGSKEIQNFADIEKFKNICRCSGVMIARTAQSNCSIFRRDGLLDLDTVICQYLKLAIDFDNSPSNTKYCIQNMLKELQDTPRGRKFLDSQTLEQISSIWELGEYCWAKKREFHAKGIFGRREISPTLLSNRKRLKIDNIENTNNNSASIEMKCAFIRADYVNDNDLPKSRINRYCRERRIKFPTYKTIQDNKLFKSIVSFQNKQYSSSFWEKNKRFSEQGAAIVLAHYLGLISREELIKNGTILEQ